MHSGSRYFSSLLLAAAFFVPAVTTGCATHAIKTPTTMTIIAGTAARGFTTTNGSSRLITTTATSSGSTGTSKSNIGSGVTTITTTMITTTITTGARKV